jgi:hypothetical protein
LYVQLALIGDVDTLTDIGTTYLEQSMGPNWVGRPGNPENILIEGSGQIAAEVIDQASLVPPEAFAAIGTSIYNIPMQTGTRATAPARITFAADTPAVAVPIDAEVAVPHPSGNELIFLTDEEAVAPIGGGTIDINVVALEPAVEYNGAFGESELIEVIDGVQSVEVLMASVGGTDPETSDEYLDRLTAYLTIPRRPVLPEDHANLALQVPGVGRATAYNLYYPGKSLADLDPPQAVGDYALWLPQPAPAAPQSGVARCTTVAIQADGGVAPTPGLLQTVYETLDANREINFLNFVVSPTYTAVDVKADVKPYSGANPADVEASVDNVLSNMWLDPESWSQPPGSGAGVWEADNKVRLYEAVDFINRGSGVWYCENVMLKLSSDSTWVEDDITLPGIAPVPTAGTMTINII